MRHYHFIDATDIKVIIGELICLIVGLLLGIMISRSEERAYRDGLPRFRRREMYYTVSAMVKKGGR